MFVIYLVTEIVISRLRLTRQLKGQVESLLNYTAGTRVVKETLTMVHGENSSLKCLFIVIRPYYCPGFQDNFATMMEIIEGKRTVDLKVKFCHFVGVLSSQSH